MDAWDKLLEGSTIQSGDAWEHLDAQGGSGEAGDVYYIGSMLTADAIASTSANVHTSSVEAEIGIVLTTSVSAVSCTSDVKTTHEASI